MSTSLVHTPDCLFRHANAVRWWKRWKGACRNCGATGEISWYEDVVGDGGPLMSMGEFCPKCIDANLCPLCGLSGIFQTEESENPGPCSACGFILGNVRTHAPYDPWSEPFCCSAAFPEVG